MNPFKISVTPPKNLPFEDANLLFPNLDYEVEQLEVKSYTHVFVSRAGIILKNLGLVSASVHSYKHLRLYFYKIAIGNYLLKKRKKLRPNDRFLIVHNIWSNGYFHWVCEALPRLWAVKSDLPDLTLLLPDNYQGSKTDSLNPFQFKGVCFQPKDINFIAPHLVLPSNPQKVYEPDPTICEAIRTFYLIHISQDLKSKFDFGTKIYVSRAKAKARKVANETELSGLLDQYGFRIICFEDYSFWEQVAIMSQVQHLISIHGAGLTNMHFMPAGGSVLELYKEREPKVDYGRVRRSDLPSPCYCRLANALQHKYYIQFCPGVDPIISAGKSNVVVDKVKLEGNIRLMLNI